MRKPAVVLFFSFFVHAGFAGAHVGSPDIFEDVKAGPYSLFVTIKPPTVIPGVASLEVRAQTTSVRSMQAVPLPMNGPGTRFAPVPDELQRSTEDPQLFTGALWMMAPGSWQVRITAEGVSGTGATAIPVPTAALRTRTMQAGLGALLWVCMSFLVLGAAAIVGASVRESKLQPGSNPDLALIRKGRSAARLALALTILVVYLGGRWWKSEATSYENKVYKPLQMQAARRGTTLSLRLHEPGWLQAQTGGDFRDILPVVRSSDDLILDHQHLMHLYVLREPALDVAFHLHPQRSGPGFFLLSLPSMPAGRYKLYADVTHASGFPETLVSDLLLHDALNGRTLNGDDGTAVASPVDQADLTRRLYSLPDGYQMEWVTPSTSIRSLVSQHFTFRLLDQSGHAPQDMQLYMGMLGHAAFVNTDGSVFAHIHPEGSVSMAALAQAQASASSSRVQIPASNEETMAQTNMPFMQMEKQTAFIPNTVSFPYGLPKAGRFRIFVQMRHGHSVETAVFDLEAT